MLWLLVFACDDEEQRIQEAEDAAYEAGCDDGRYAGSVAGTDDGTECRKRAEVPDKEAHKGMLEYCASLDPTDEQLDTQCDCSQCDCLPEAPCEWWEDGYRNCWLEGYDHSYRIGWDAAHCDSDTAI